MKMWEKRLKRFDEIIKAVERRKEEKDRDYYLQELVNETGIPRSTLERYVEEDLSDKLEVYYDGPLKRIRLRKN